MPSKLFLSILSLFLLVSFPLISSVWASSMMWSQTYGGSYNEEAGVLTNEEARSLVETSDGGYVIAGTTTSFGAGGFDVWLVKTDANGNMEWNQTYGGTGRDYVSSLVETSDGGYALAGSTDSFGGVGPNFYLVKTDANGNMEWNQSYSGALWENACSLVESSDGGYAIAGYVWSGDGNVDFWFVKTDANGNMKWNQTYGGTDNNEYAYSLVETSDGGYAIAGETRSSVDPAYDFWLVKTDKFGNMEWNKTIGGEPAGWPQVRALVLTSDGGFALASGGLLVKTDASGNMEWTQTYDGGTIFSMVQVSDGGYGLAGDTSSGAGRSDFWLVKTDANGIVEWSQNYGGSEVEYSESLEDKIHEYAYSLVEISDGGYALAGYTVSDFDVDRDFWLIKTNEYGVPEFPSWTPLLIMLVAVVAVTVIYRHNLTKQNQGRADK
jgi:hypothetical protein